MTWVFSSKAAAFLELSPAPIPAPGMSEASWPGRQNWTAETPQDTAERALKHLFAAFPLRSVVWPRKPWVYSATEEALPWSP